MTRAKLPDIDRVNCKRCGHKKLRIAAGKYDARNKRYVDNNGRNWNGRVCPTCHNKRIKEGMQTLRADRKKQSEFENHDKHIEAHLEALTQLKENE